MAPATHHTPNSYSYARKPATIAILAERALENIWDEGRELKHFLRIAEKSRKDGKEFARRGDLENAFVSFARAATLVLEKLPTHRDYKKLLNESQRQNLMLNGQDILDNLGALKPQLLHNYEQWEKQHQDEPDNDRTPDTSHDPIYVEEQYEQDYSPRRSDRRYEDKRVRAREREREKEQSGREYGRVMQEELQRWKEQREEINRQREEEETSRSSRQRDAVAAARHTAGRPEDRYTPHAPPSAPELQRLQEESNRQQQQQELSRHQQQQEEFRRREEEIVRRREQKRREEQHGIVQRQQEAEQEARAARQNIAANHSSIPVAATPSSSASTPPSSTPSSSLYQIPTPTQVPYADLHAPRAVTSRPPSFMAPDDVPVPPVTPLPLENPARYEGDSTDSESLNNHANEWRRKHKHAIEHSRSTTRAPARSPYPPPVTTTSPPPVEGSRILYPQLMSQHQKTQGYFPSLNSMFGPVLENHNANTTSSLLFVPEQTSRDLYPHNMLPQPSMAPQPQYQHGHQPSPSSRPPQSHHPHSHSHTHSHAQSHTYPSYPGPSRPQPPVPVPAPTVPLERITRASSLSTRKDGPILQTVNLPRECLPRFLTIARANTERNMETCGLLLGRDKGNKYVVSTLLIPKQHSTSDTCTMDEEELVMRFTEERGLITLGWIHTHPSQSCFMSSVDLHTHSGFQRMLPESFAVVCAPKSTPNFGIFRLTDPPGIKTILECQAKEAFHPHPDLPIYTDADKGHVQMRDMSLEIVDLR